MTNGEAVNWIINIMSDIGKTEHQELWHYEQALAEIREMLESTQPEQHFCRECKWCLVYANVNKYGDTQTFWYCQNWCGETDEEGFCHEWERRGDVTPD